MFFLRAQRCVDRGCSLTVVLAEAVCVNLQRDVSLCVAKPLADCHDVDPCINELAGVRVAQCVESDDALPKGIRAKMADHLRLSHRGGEDGLNRAMLASVRLARPNFRPYASGSGVSQ